MAWVVEHWHVPRPFSVLFLSMTPHTIAANKWDSRNVNVRPEQYAISWECEAGWPADTRANWYRFIFGFCSRAETTISKKCSKFPSFEYCIGRGIRFWTDFLSLTQRITSCTRLLFIIDQKLFKEMEIVAKLLHFFVASP